MEFRILAKSLGAAAAACLAISALLPPPVEGYNLLGGALRLSQRDVRVFDNFTDPESHENVQKDPSFPSATGAVLAIWKAAVEWGSEAHGDGLGDPVQPVLGSGGANFDFCWQGRATSVGGPSDNVVSQISGQSGAVLAYTETPIHDGWRIRYYADAAIWHDGPGHIPASDGSRDIQGVATHELGHALGLAHSGDLDATMISFLLGSGVAFRTIEPDDAAGIQALYGPRAPDKPHVSGYEIEGNSLTVAGSGFAAADNEVWFTRRSANADGTPEKIGGLPSFESGTRIPLTITAEVAQGDLLVHRPGQGGSSLSNAFPFDPSTPPCPPIVRYGTAKANSQGGLPSLEFSGRPTVRTDDFHVGTLGGIPDQHGFLLSSSAPGATPFQGGTLLVSQPLRREQKFQFDSFGGADLAVPVTAGAVGTTRYYQIWFVDPGDSFGTGLSDALEVAFCP